MAEMNVAGWLRFAWPVLVCLLVGLAQGAQAGCILAAPIDKGAHIDESFQHTQISPTGFFELFYNSTGDSALAADRVPRILAALDSSHFHYQQLTGVWPIPLGPRLRYPVLVVRQPVPGATTLPFESGGIGGLTWIQLDHDMSRWGGDPDKLLDVTCAHELFHALQFARGADLRDLVFYEASAVWAEDQVFPAHDDWAQRYLPALLENLEAPLDHRGNQREYGTGAVLKFLLTGAGSWLPCRQALVDGGALQRAWPLMLEMLEEPELELGRCLAELLHAGGDLAPEPFRVPELLLADPIQVETFPALTRGGGIPEVARELQGLSWLPLRVAEAGIVELESAGATFLLSTGSRHPVSLTDSTSHAVERYDWLLLVNADNAAQPGITAIEWLDAVAAPFRIWPNPGGALRWVEFQSAPGKLEFFNLLGQKVGEWSPTPTPARQALLLPPVAAGPLLVRANDGHSTLLFLR